MPAPRLLDKKVITASLANERKQEIDKGIKLAKSVDALREAREREEQELEDFRVRTLKVVQVEIDAKQVENQQLLAKNTALKEERARLEEPVDLTEAWAKIVSDKEKVALLEQNLEQREADLSLKETDLAVRTGLVEGKEEELGALEEIVRKNLEESETRRAEAEDAASHVHKLRSGLELELEQKSALLKEQEARLTSRESSISLKEKELDKDRLDINREKTLLADRQALLERGFAELKRKK